VRSVRAATTVSLVIGLLGASASGAVAQSADTEPAVFGWSVSQGEGDGPPIIDATDPRVSGTLTIGMGDAAIAVEDVPILASFSLRITNDGGSWAGSGRAYRGGEGQAVSIWEFTGEAGYEGLTAYMFGDGEIEEPWGILVSGAAIPPFPPVPAE
jgi:hypothetical protein